MGDEEESVGSKSKEITWHNSRREWLLSIGDYISQILIRQLPLARTYAYLGCWESKRERCRETEMYKVRSNGRDKASENNVKEGRETRISSFAVPPKKVKKGTTTRNGGCRPDGTREVRLAAVPRVVMRN